MKISPVAALVSLGIVLGCGFGGKSELPMDESPSVITTSEMEKLYKILTSVSNAFDPTYAGTWDGERGYAPHASFVQNLVTRVVALLGDSITPDMAGVIHDETYLRNEVVDPAGFSTEDFALAESQGRAGSKMRAYYIGANPNPDSVSLLPQDGQHIVAQRFEKAVTSGTVKNKISAEELGLDTLYKTDPEAFWKFFELNGKTVETRNGVKVMVDRRDTFTPEQILNRKDLINLFHTTWESMIRSATTEASERAAQEWIAEATRRQQHAVGSVALTQQLSERVDLEQRGAQIVWHLWKVAVFYDPEGGFKSNFGGLFGRYIDIDESTRRADAAKLAGVQLTQEIMARAFEKPVKPRMMPISRIHY